MKKHLLNYDTILKVTQAISHSHDPEEVVLMAVNSIRDALVVKGCTLFLINHKTKHLEAAASMGLSTEYLNKGPVSAVESIPRSLEGPVAISDVMDDPRIQYPEAAKKEGIASILSVPVAAGGHVLGSLRVYTDKRWDFTLNDVNFVQAMACLAGLAIIMARQYKGMKDSLEFLKSQRAVKTMKSGKRTSYEGIPVSAPVRKPAKKKK
ncbi:MAG: GAF domain-containing protein [Desulfobacterota bacterium]|nr:GAF domain-containing protein [Thermodesulfobacteriota bacterium]